MKPGLEQASGRGLWIANAACDLIQIGAGAVRAHMKL